MRYFVELSYKGTRFHGWQMQNNACSIQEVLNRALSTILRQDISACGCGRTDTGVHARQFFAHFDATQTIDNTADLTYKLNRILPPDIYAFRIFAVTPDAHARFDAVQRTYKYFICTDRNPFLQEFACYFPYTLNIRKMNAASRLLLQASDFGAFAKSHSNNKTNICRLTHASFTADKEKGLLVFTISADRFLRNMVRAIAGTLLDVGRGKLNHKEMMAVIESADRSAAGASVPAAGLFLWEVRYPYVTQV